ncbi:HAD family hydrolase [Pararhodobacter zhoushanensis]|uniref:HAD family hydrolase n=1 Tax=Pararhodobacter zhoushanensis TaxID=2479545 RepID=A0ABT3H1Y1_9RHOB|nr:HAD family hydrolase [Pararhodobacter zhoushanensis]MCW1933854.1 HAD family hydrolase [Pararhodobacter zhoushanensis]
MPPGLVIFDCDGVLVDSETISLSVMLSVLAEAGCVLTVQEGYAHFLGKSLGSVGEWLKRERGVTLTDALLAEMRHRLLSRFEADLQPIPGVAEAITALDLPVCVASSSQPDRIRLSLRVTGLLPLFEPQIFSATMVANGKPAPDLFLLAARTLGVDPADCVVIEDSPAGLTAARAAGMRAVGFVGGAHAEPANLRLEVEKLAPESIIDTMADLPAVLRGLG